MVVQEHRRRQDVPARGGAARGSPRSLDQSEEFELHDPVERRRGERVARRRADLEHADEPADGGDLPGRGGRPVSVPRVRRAAGQYHADHPEPAGGGRAGFPRGAGVRDGADHAGPGPSADRVRRLQGAVQPPEPEHGQRGTVLGGRGIAVRQRGRDADYRFQRVSPMEISPRDQRVVYYGSQYLHRTRDGGVTWEKISPDLTANPPGEPQEASGGPITRDATGEEVYSTLYAIKESPVQKGVIWTGSNDGVISVTRDDGKTWANVTPKDLPPGGRVQNIEASPHRAGTAYVAVYRYLLGDFAPYIYRTDDFGKTWTRLTDGHNGIAADEPTRVVREDPDRAGLLYAGTEFGMYISYDNGAQWQSFQLNLPATPVTDIRIAHKDLILSTQGRGFWILDNLTLLHQLPQVP